MNQTPNHFMMAVAQVGAEWALKDEVSRRWPQLHFAFSRPGFVTFKLQGDETSKLQGGDETSQRQPHMLLVGSVFARTCAWSLGQVSGDNESVRIEKLRELAQQHNVQRIHIWMRDRHLPGKRDFEPGLNDMARQIALRTQETWPAETACPGINTVAHMGEVVLDCVLVEPNSWWVGWHRVEATPQRWPGGVPLQTAPDEMISRAYFKTSEALAWSRLPIAANDAIVELGCSPGGSSQALVDRGYRVTGIDPADVDSRLLQREEFTHVKKRGGDLKRREYRDFRWLTADLNVDPNYTLDTAEHIVTHNDVNIDGLLLTLKLLERPHYAMVADYLQRIRSWGYEEVRARQLAFNRHEICVAALRKKSLRAGWKD